MDALRLREVLHRLIHPEEHELVVASLFVLHDHRPPIPFRPRFRPERNLDLIGCKALESSGDTELGPSRQHGVSWDQLDGERTRHLNRRPWPHEIGYRLTESERVGEEEEGEDDQEPGVRPRQSGECLLVYAPAPLHPTRAKDGRPNEAVQQVAALRVRPFVDRLDRGENLRPQIRLMFVEVECDLSVAHSAKEGPNQSLERNDGGGCIEQARDDRGARGPPSPAVNEDSHGE